MLPEVPKSSTHTSNRRRPVAALARALALTMLVACNRGDAATEKPSAGAAAVADSTLPSVLATVGDEKITLADVRTRAGDPLEQLETQFRRVRDKLVAATLDTIITGRLVTAEMKKTGKTAEELIAAEAAGKSFEPTEAEIATWFQENQARLGGRTLDQVRSQIGNLLRNDRKGVASDKLMTRLKSETKVAINFAPWRPQ